MTTVATFYKYSEGVSLATLGQEVCFFFLQDYQVKREKSLKNKTNAAIKQVGTG